MSQLLLAMRNLADVLKVETEGFMDGSSRGSAVISSIANSMFRSLSRKVLFKPNKSRQVESLREVTGHRLYFLVSNSELLLIQNPTTFSAIARQILRYV